MVRHHVKLLRAVCGLSLTALTADGRGLAIDPRVETKISPSLAGAVRSGDLVFRIGRGWRAEAVRALSRTAFSHVGIARVTDRGIDVIHATPPEGGSAGGVVEESLASFASPARSNGIALYRRADLQATVEARIAIEARKFVKAHTPFDERFDLADGRAMYCTELVLRASMAAGAGFPVASTSVGGIFAGSYLLPRDLIASHRFRLVGLDQPFRGREVAAARR